MKKGKKKGKAESTKKSGKRGLWAVVAGLLFVIVVSTSVDVALHALKVYGPWTEPISDPLALLATGYRFVISVAGAYLTARLAPQRPLHHALILGYVGIPLGLLGVLGNYIKPMGSMWYPIALVVLAVPQCWLGGWLYEKRHS
jgi:hypothetical protein